MSEYSWIARFTKAGGANDGLPGQFCPNVVSSDMLDAVPRSPGGIGCGIDLVQKDGDEVLTALHLSRFFYVDDLNDSTFIPLYPDRSLSAVGYATMTVDLDWLANSRCVRESCLKWSTADLAKPLNLTVLEISGGPGEERAYVSEVMHLCGFLEYGTAEESYVDLVFYPQGTATIELEPDNIGSPICDTIGDAPIEQQEGEFIKLWKTKAS